MSDGDVRTSPANPSTTPDTMPTTRGLNFELEGRNVQFLCGALLASEDVEGARPHLVELGALAGGELDDSAAETDRHPPEFRVWDASRLAEGAHRADARLGDGPGPPRRAPI